MLDLAYRGLRLPRLGRGRGFNPARLAPSVAGRLAVYDPSRLSSLFQLSDGSTPVTAFGQPVGRLSDTSVNALHAVQASADLRPLYARVPQGGRRNMLPNSGNSGAVVGVVGSGGALPTGWTSSSSLAREILETWDGGFTIRLTGTLTGNFFINTSGSTVVSAAAGQTWIASIFVQVMGANSGVTSFRTTLATRLIDGAPKQDVAVTDIDLPMTFTRTATPAATLSNAGGAAGDVAFVLSYLRLVCNGTVDITLRLGGAQLEQAAAITPLQNVSLNGADITEAGRASRFALLNDLSNDALAVTLPAATYTVATANDPGVTITAGVVHGGGAYTLPGPQRLYGAVIIDRALTAAETAKVTGWLNARRP